MTIHGRVNSKYIQMYDLYKSCRVKGGRMSRFIHAGARRCRIKTITREPEPQLARISTDVTRRDTRQSHPSRLPRPPPKRAPFPTCRQPDRFRLISCLQCNVNTRRSSQTSSATRQEVRQQHAIKGPKHPAPTNCRVVIYRVRRCLLLQTARAVA